MRQRKDILWVFSVVSVAIISIPIILILVYRIGQDGKREYLFLVRKEGFLDFPKGHIEEGCQN